MTAGRLAPGVELVTVPGQGLAVRTQDGEFLRVGTGRVAVDELVARFEGGPQGSPELEELVTAFEDAGYAGERTARPLAGLAVHVLGDELPAGALANRAAAAGADITRGDGHRLTVPGEGAGRPDVVVWCLDSPVPEGLWDAADRLPAQGVGWLRCHREGFQVWLEPLAAEAGDVTSADIRLRRLAASPAHRELAAYWAGHRTAGTPPCGTEASAALIAELLTADLIAWATGRRTPGRPPARRRLRRLDLRDLTVSEHPVLPVPAVAPVPGRGAPR
ncbi:hypothetical protein [Streptomyces fulvorobeus]|uniref:Uncharacterized protein n=1 Tax=Streptomyces fulvorobeus TaxID=284028 RepID=A0A7J0CBI9_9ACTN|nr:hypothetical protein [Streptomyces fulvorobeus]NYE43430.1 hypothetical protein [Streptomyces fulvorobeus]GFM99895.1 hypothetical protein Sfulv_47060 [Streptomyces fulvorobeus]